jgi:hypothetical protein
LLASAKLALRRAAASPRMASSTSAWMVEASLLMVLRAIVARLSSERAIFSYSPPLASM